MNSEINTNPGEPPPKQDQSPAAKDPLIGTTIDNRFFIEDVLGTGGMSVVYKARQLRVNRYVAIKTIRLQVDTHSTVRERFLREVDTLCALSHPNIVSVFDCIFGPDDQPYIVMDLLRGKSLEALLREEGPMNLNRFARISVQVMSALEHAHKKGVIHRDLKPGNVMLVDNEEDFVKVVDFGLAKLEEAGRKLTRAGEIWGSPPYMSPEQAMSEPSDARSDIYSLAAVMFEMLTGRDPFFEASSVYELIQAHVQREPPYFAHANPNIQVPMQVEKSIRKALEKNPEDRYQSIGAFQNDLIGGLSGQLDRTGSEYILHFGSSALAEGVTASHNDLPIFTGPNALNPGASGVHGAGAIGAPGVSGTAGSGVGIGYGAAGAGQGAYAPGSYKAAPETGDSSNGQNGYHRLQMTPGVNSAGSSPYAPGDPDLSDAQTSQTDTLWKRKAGGSAGAQAGAQPVPQQPVVVSRLRERQILAQSRFHWLPWALAGASVTLAVCMGMLIFHVGGLGKQSPGMVQSTPSSDGTSGSVGSSTAGGSTSGGITKTAAGQTEQMSVSATAKRHHTESHAQPAHHKPHEVKTEHVARPHVTRTPAENVRPHKPTQAVPSTAKTVEAPKHHKEHPSSSAHSGGKPGGADPWNALMQMRKGGK